MKKSLHKYPATRNVEMDPNMGGIAVHVDDDAVTYIFLPYSCSVGDMAHESWHATKRMMEYVGVELDSETCAYHLGFLTGKIFRFVRNK
jgi:hypothetical protein